MMTGRWLFLTVLCWLLTGMSTSAWAATNHSALLAAFCATDGNKAAALEQFVEAGVSDETQDQAWARLIVDAIRNSALVCNSSRLVTIQGTPPLDAATLKTAANSNPGDSPYVPSIVMMRKLMVASAEI